MLSSSAAELPFVGSVFALASAASDAIPLLLPSDPIPLRCVTCGLWIHSFVGHFCAFSALDDDIPPARQSAR